MSNYLGVASDDAQLATVTLTGPGSTKVTAMGRINISLTPVSVAAATAAEQNFTVPGVLQGDFIDVTPPGITAGVAPVTARATAANTIAVTFVNPTAGALTPLAGVYQIQLLR